MIEWTADRVETLKQLWADGRMARQIAVALGATPEGRCAVLGKVHRLGLERRQKPKPKKRQGPSNRLAIKAPAAIDRDDTLSRIEAAPPPAEFLGIPFGELTNEHCRYPRSADDGPILFCGQPKQRGSSYCPACHARCWHRRIQLSPEERARRRMQGRKNFESRAFP